MEINSNNFISRFHHFSGVFCFALLDFFLGTEQASGSCIFLEHLPNRLLIESLPVVPYRHLKSNAESSIMDLDLDPHKKNHLPPPSFGKNQLPTPLL